MGKNYLKKPMHALNDLFNFPRNKSKKTVFPRPPAKASLQIFHRVYRTHVKAAYRMGNKKLSIIWETQTRQSQVYCWKASASDFFPNDLGNLIIFEVQCVSILKEKRCFAVKSTVNMFRHEPVWTNDSNGCAQTLISIASLMVANIQLAWRRIRFHGTLTPKLQYLLK